MAEQRISAGSFVWDFPPLNPESRHIACVLLVGVSDSMQNDPLNELNEVLAKFGEMLNRDDYILDCTDVCVIAFNQSVNVVVPFGPASMYKAPVLRASSVTAMNEAIIAGLDIIEQRINLYRQLDVDYRRPLLFLLTDGVSTDLEYENTAKQRLQDALSNKKVAFFPMYVGEGADLAHLGSYNGDSVLQRAHPLKVLVWLETRCARSCVYDYSYTSADSRPCPPRESCEPIVVDDCECAATAASPRQRRSLPGILSKNLREFFHIRKGPASRAEAQREKGYMAAPACMVPAMMVKPRIPSLPRREAARQIDEVKFSAVTEDRLAAGESSVICLVMYTEEFADAVGEAKDELGDGAKAHSTSWREVPSKARVSIRLASDDLDTKGCVDEFVWDGKYNKSFFGVTVPAGFEKRKAVFDAIIGINELPAIHLRFMVGVGAGAGQRAAEIHRSNVHSAFLSYASQDRAHVLTYKQAAQGWRPDVDFFVDVQSLREGEDWRKRLAEEIEGRDLFVLFWSASARDSEWVEFEWRHALKEKGIDRICPFAIDGPRRCEPPDELSRLHFNSPEAVYREWDKSCQDGS